MFIYNSGGLKRAPRRRQRSATSAPGVPGFAAKYKARLGARLRGRAGAVMNAINDALIPFKARVSGMPFTPQRVLQALGRM
ncbi:MAG: hypothetical protein EXR29_06490 [Betaproteobacteria bacterium]|nr:hypothetical protein [Betaproteobacteria bacterium]